MAEHEPDIVLMDIRMPGMDGLAATELLRAHDDAPEVIVLTTFEADDDVLRALRAGASGFLLKDTPPADIVRAVRAVAAGEPMLSPTITRRLIGHVTDGEADDRQRHAREQLDRLTEREREVAVAVGQRQVQRRDRPRALHERRRPSRRTSRACSRSSSSTTASRSPCSPTTPGRRDRFSAPAFDRP